VAEEKLILLNNIFSLSNLFANIKTDEVFAVPDPPTNNTALLQRAVLGWVKMRLVRISDLKESTVGINN